MDLISCKFNDSKLEILFVNMDRDEDRKWWAVWNNRLPRCVVSTSSIPLVDAHQPHDYSVVLASEILSPFSIMESNSYRLHIWERTQCLQIQSMILYNYYMMQIIQFS
ncbi:unnamed protein product [Vicia faba]|uniref:Uncharacterized protein n=1 Tax=Vicia faba TaxID=3906 RepID=A0AAV0ZHK7_VICFA|nr:unnamed protein product [Vicia faba]